MAEQSDSITIIVSEETGNISIAMNGKLQKIKLASFQEELTAILKNN
ncbi:diadenylate cyclase [Mycoplasma todarodis]